MKRNMTDLEPIRLGLGATKIQEPLDFDWVKLRQVYLVLVFTGVFLIATVNLLLEFF